MNEELVEALERIRELEGELIMVRGLRDPHQPMNPWPAPRLSSEPLSDEREFQLRKQAEDILNSKFPGATPEGLQEIMSRVPSGLRESTNHRVSGWRDGFIAGFMTRALGEQP